MCRRSESLPHNCRFCTQDIIRDCTVCSGVRRRMNLSVPALRVVFSKLLRFKSCAVLADLSAR